MLWRARVLVVLAALACLVAAGPQAQASEQDAKKGGEGQGGPFGKRARGRHIDPNFRNITASVFEWQSRFLASNKTNDTLSTTARDQPTAWQRWLGGRASLETGTTAIVDGECQLIKRTPPKKEFLVLVAVGNTANPLTWLNHAKWANFDVIALYFGDNGFFDCPQCKKVYHGKSQKYILFYSLHQEPEWKNLTAGYKAVMTADDDLIMTTCEINRHVFGVAFEVFDRNQLLLGQMSLCEGDGSWSWWRMMYQQKDKVLRYVSFVEIMAPIFSMADGFYDEFIVPTMHDAYTGWGLDFVWPFLLRYPKDRIAVIDEVCMVHPSKKRAGSSIYESGVPYNQRVEEARREAQFGYTRAAVRRMGYSFYMVQEFGSLERQKWKSALERLELSVQRHLGPWFPLVLGLQTLALALCLLWLAMRKLHQRAKGKRV